MWRGLLGRNKNGADIDRDEPVNIRDQNLAGRRTR